MKESHVVGPELVIARGDATELFELVEEALNMIALTVKRLGPAKALLAPDHVRNVGDGAACLDVGTQAVCVVGLIGDDDRVAFEIG